VATILNIPHRYMNIGTYLHSGNNIPVQYSTAILYIVYIIQIELLQIIN